jgi:hypothetical protein
LVRTGWIAAAFTAVVLAVLAVVFLRGKPIDPAEDVLWQQLRQRALSSPDDPAAVETFRQWDLQLRKQYFWEQRLRTRGAWLALIGTVVAVACFVAAAQLRQRLVLPGEPQFLEYQERQERAEALRMLGLALLLVGVGGIWLAVVFAPPAQWERLAKSLASRGNQLGQVAGSEVASAKQEPAIAAPAGTARETTEAATAGKSSSEKPGEGPPAPAPIGARQLSPEVKEAFWEAYCRNWPRFRGPEGSGISRTGPVPISWDVPAGKGVLWKTEVPLPGNSSPVVWEERIFLTGASPDRLCAYCYDAQTGQLLWEREIPSGASPPLDPKKVAKETGFASPTPATDGKRVYVMFAPGDVASLDFSGNLLWNRNLGVPDNVYGHAASLECFADRVLIQFDQGSRAQEGKSRLIALDAETGETLFEVPRPVPNSWASPALVRSPNGFLLVTAAAPWIIAYDPESGSEIWRFAGLEGDVGPSPVCVDSIVYAGNEYSFWFAVRADGQGDVTQTHLLWKAEENLPDLCSPLATAEYVFLLASWGMLTCYDAKNGEKLWELELEASFISSPGMAGECLYVIGEKQQDTADGERTETGICWVIRPGREGGEIVSENPLGEGCTASPAFKDGKLYLRGRKHLMCIAEPK